METSSEFCLFPAYVFHLPSLSGTVNQTTTFKLSLLIHAVSLRSCFVLFLNTLGLTAITPLLEPGLQLRFEPVYMKVNIFCNENQDFIYSPWHVIIYVGNGTWPLSSFQPPADFADLHIFN